MSTRGFLVVFAGLLLFSMVAVQWSGPSVDAQDTTEDRVSALETQVADLDTRVSNHGREIERLEDRVATLEAGSQPSETGDSDSPSQPSGDSATVSGVGVMVSDDCSLAPSKYKYRVVLAGPPRRPAVLPGDRATARRSAKLAKTQHQSRPPEHRTFSSPAARRSSRR